METAALLVVDLKIAVHASTVPATSSLAEGDVSFIPTLPELDTYK
jgi:hypothetical protein